MYSQTTPLPVIQNRIMWNHRMHLYPRTICCKNKDIWLCVITVRWQSCRPAVTSGRNMSLNAVVWLIVTLWLQIVTHHFRISSLRVLVFLGDFLMRKSPDSTFQEVLQTGSCRSNTGGAWKGSKDLKLHEYHSPGKINTTCLQGLYANFNLL